MKAQMEKKPVHNILSLLKRIEALEAVVLREDRKVKSVQKIEDFNGEVVPEIREDAKLKMQANDKIQSMKNAIVILPPNLIKDGRHAAHNIEAICGFKVSDEMMDAAYSEG